MHNFFLKIRQPPPTDRTPRKYYTFLKKGLYYLTVLLILAVLPFVLQYLHLGNLHTALLWTQKPNSPYNINLSIILILFIVLYPVLNSVFYSLAALVGFCGIFIIIDTQKMHILNQPLLPSDFIFLKQAVLIGRLYAGQAVISCIILFILCSVLFLVRKKAIHFRLPLPIRGLLFAAIACFFIFSIKQYQKILRTINTHFHLTNEYWNQLTNSNKNGVLYTFFMNLESMTIARPHDYCKKTMESIFTSIPYDSTPPARTSPAFQPDVIICLSESFWDISQITTLPLPCDPIPVFRSLEKRKYAFHLVSPVFGGNTCNAEFEVLTGMSHQFFPPGVMAYNQFIQHPIPSLVNVFKENGYTTTGIHTFKRWFWNRVNVYRQLGFDSYISVENMKNPHIKGFYVSDMELVKTIMEQASSTQHPDFIFALSMQNHGPYNVKRYDSLDCPVAANLSQPADRELNSYMQGLIDADAALGTLVSYIDTVHQPTLLLFFGDHLPGFTHLYKETGIDKRIARDTLWAHTTMAVWYANYPLQQPTDSIMSMMYLPSLITQQASIQEPRYYHYLDCLRSEFPVFLESRPQNGNISGNVDSLFTRRRNECRLCVYDALLGKCYADHYHHSQHH